MNPVIWKSLFFAGLISNILAVIVCLGFGEYDYIPTKTFNVVLWTASYWILKLNGRW